MRIVYGYAGSAVASGRPATVPARRVPGYPPAGGRDAWLLEPNGHGWEGARETAAQLRFAEPGTPIFVESQGNEDNAAVERAGFRRRAARLRLLGVERYLVPPRGVLPSPGDLAKAALAAATPGDRLVVRGDPRSASVHLTFDDGPHPEHTPVLLDALAAAGATATFFVVGAQAEKRPDLVKRIVAEGHALGHHSYTHSSPPRTSARALLEEVKRTCDLLGDLVGYAPRLFRPPRGQITTEKLARLWLARQKVMLWNVDPRDFACATSDDLRAALVDRDLRGGDIVLLHDDHPRFAPLLPELARDLGQRGLKLRALDP